MQEAFYNHLFSNFQTYCIDKGLSPTTAIFLDYMIQSGLIRQPEIHHYVILHDYERLIQIQKFKNKTQTIKYISQKYELHENTIWNVLKDHRDKFVLEDT